MANPGRAPRLLITASQKKPGPGLTGLELLQLPAKIMVAGLQVVGLRVHIVHALLQLGPLLLLLRSPVLLAAAPAHQGLLHLRGQGRDAGPSSRGDTMRSEESGMGRGRVLPTSLISSCKCSSSEFCSLMKLNSAKFRSSTGGQWGKAGSGETRDAQAETHTGGRGQKARDEEGGKLGKTGRRSVVEAGQTVRVQLSRA